MPFPNTSPSPFEHSAGQPGGPPDLSESPAPVISPVQPLGRLAAQREVPPEPAPPSQPGPLPVGHISRVFMAKLGSEDTARDEGGEQATGTPAAPGQPPLEASDTGAFTPTETTAAAGITDTAPEIPEIEPSTLWDFKEALHDLKPHATRREISEVTAEYPNTEYSHEPPLTVSCIDTWTVEPGVSSALDEPYEADLTFSIDDQSILGPLSEWIDPPRIASAEAREEVEEYIEMEAYDPKDVWLREAYSVFTHTRIGSTGEQVVGRLIDQSPHPVNKYTEYELRAQFNNGSSITAEWNTEPDDTPALLPSDTHNRAQITVRTADGTLYQYYSTQGEPDGYWSGPEATYEDQLPDLAPCTTQQLAELTRHIQAAVQSGVVRPPEAEPESEPPV